MEEQSGISAAATNVTKEIADSNSVGHLIQNKHQKGDGNVSSSSFKGVVVQHNGHWRAQIFANHQRIWLGTFESEIEAAMAYDSASIKLRNGDSHRNVPWTKISIMEPSFQSHFSTKDVLNMIKDGSYVSKFFYYLRSQSHVAHDLVAMPKNGGFFCKKLFYKELTDIDVGKLNRLVIPKKFAIMYFPQISEDTDENENTARVDDTELVFFDRSMRSWKFYYCYWKSSQSFVFTRGWNRFVKDKGLRAKDVLIFSFCEREGGLNELQSVFMIDIEYWEGSQSSSNTFVEEKDCVETECLKKEPNGSPPKGFKLFGVQMF